MWGFVAIVAFMSLYYTLFGVISSLALAVNLLLLVALLSLLQATLTLPGIAAIALTLGMAIDANVLINERIREELRSGATPQAAIHAGYDRAWATILDSNVTTLIAGIALLMVPGAVRGFAVVHCLGILTSMFSAVVVSRAIVNLVYGHRRRVGAPVHRRHRRGNELRWNSSRSGEPSRSCGMRWSSTSSRSSPSSPRSASSPPRASTSRSSSPAAR